MMSANEAMLLDSLKRDVEHRENTEYRRLYEHERDAMRLERLTHAQTTKRLERETNDARARATESERARLMAEAKAVRLEREVSRTRAIVALARDMVQAEREGTDAGLRAVSLRLERALGELD